MNVVLGAPIPVTRKANPSNQEIADLHEQYVLALRDLFETNKEKYGVASTAQLVIH